jgi:hypothetical protein
MGIWLRRSIWSVALGLITAWLVAWGITIASWNDWLDLSSPLSGRGTGLASHWLINIMHRERPCYEWGYWSGQRIDLPTTKPSLIKKAERIGEIRGGAYAVEDRIPSAGVSTIKRIDEKVSEFPPPELEGLIALVETDGFSFDYWKIGWPKPMLMARGGFIIDSVGNKPFPSRIYEGSIEISAMKRPPIPGGPLESLRLPYLPVWPAVIANTAVFGGSWFALFTGVAALRSLRRRMAGQCSRCGYDLKRVVGKTCPECGRTSR